MNRIFRFLELELGTIGGTRFTFGSVLSILFGLLLSVVVTEGIARGVSRILKRRGVSDGTRFSIARLVRYVVGTLAILVVLMTSGINLHALLAASTVALVGIGLGVQRIAQDFLSGLILLVEQPVQKGDFIRLGDTNGTVEHIGGRTTRVVTRDRVTLIVPNSELTGAIVKNFSRPVEWYRVSVRFSVAYGANIDLVRRCVMDEAKGLSPRILDEPAPELFFEDFGESGLKFVLSFLIEDPREELRIASALRFAIEQVFKKEGIAFPFPQLDVHLRRPPSEIPTTS